MGAHGPAVYPDGGPAGVPGFDPRAVPSRHPDSPPPPDPDHLPVALQLDSDRFPWTWSAGVLAGLFGVSFWVLATRVKSLDRLR